MKLYHYHSMKSQGFMI